MTDRSMIEGRGTGAMITIPADIAIPDAAETAAGLAAALPELPGDGTVTVVLGPGVPTVPALQIAAAVARSLAALGHRVDGGESLPAGLLDSALGTAGGGAA